MRDIIGRQKEIERLDMAMQGWKPQLIVVYGRRRVGKTFLIDEYFENRFDFKFTGAFNQSTPQQLANFYRELRRVYDIDEVPRDWPEAFSVLRDYLESLDDKSKRLVFFDEMPWMDRQKSGFLPAFEWFWNSWGSAQRNLVFIVCGSATSWMTEKIDKNKGGLFNRQTCRLYLEPLSLMEVEEYLVSQNIHWSRYDIVRCYMIMGGIPFYLELLSEKQSLTENIDRLFFAKRAELAGEFGHLYETLFSNSEQYIKIVTAMSEKRKGLTRKELSASTGIPTNGVLTKMLTNLENSGFIRVNNSFGKKKRESTYQLIDYYTLFYLKFVAGNHGQDEHFWTNTTDNPSRLTWTGLTYELVCRDHINQIKKKIGISGVMSEVSTWEKKGDSEETGAQIDLVIDRRDRVINLCEIKFSQDPYEIKKSYDAALRNKVAVFRETTGTTKTLQLTMITTFGIKRNMYSNNIVKEVCLDDLFEKI